MEWTRDGSYAPSTMQTIILAKETPISTAFLSNEFDESIYSSGTVSPNFSLATAVSSLDNAKVVYNADGTAGSNSFNLTGLTSGQTYYLAAFTVDADGDGTDDNENGAVLTDNATAFEIPTINATTNLDTVQTTTSSFEISWDDPATGSAIDSVLLVINQDNNFSTPSGLQSEDLDLSDGEGVVKVLAGTENYTYTGLTECDQFFVRTYPFRGGMWHFLLPYLFSTNRDRNGKEFWCSM